MYLYSRAFKNCSSLTQFGGTVDKVLLRSNVTGAEEVFSGCTSITTVSYMFNQTDIGKEYFKGCIGINSIDFGNAKNIGESAFEGCTSIPNVRFRVNSNSTKYSISIGKNAFKGCTSIAHIYTHQEKRPLSAIGEGAFEGCTSLTAMRSWYINTSGSYSENALTGITTIGARAFYGCTALTRYGNTANKVTFADDLTTIGASAFAGCDAITNVVAPWATPIEITEDVFSTTVYENATLDYPEASLDAYKAATGWQKFFKDASAFTAVFNLLGTDGETVVGTMQLNLQTMEVGDGVKVYNDDAVAAEKLTGNAGILDLRVVKDGDDNTYPLVEIGKNAFKGVADVTDVWLTANTLTTIGESAFENCENLVAFSSNAQAATLLNIGAYAFRGTPLSQLGVNVGKYTAATNAYSTATNPLTIGDEAFKGTQICFVVNGGNIRQLGEGVFENCTMLKNNNDSVFNLTNLKSIPARAFKNCSNLVRLSNVTGITAIGDEAFYGCAKLVQFGNAADQTYLRPVKTIGASAFEGCTVLPKVYLEEVTAIGANAFKNCTNLANVTIYSVETVPTLGEGAFAGIKSNAAFYLNPNNSYLSASKYANNDSWKVWFDGTNANYILFAYVNKSKQYGTVSCDVPLWFRYASVKDLYKVVAADDSYSYLKTVTKRRLPANTGAVIEMGTQTSGENAGQLYTSAQVQVLFDGSEADADFTGNLLVANVTENTSFVGQDGNTWNLIMSNGKFVKATDGTLAAGLAYLPKTFEGGEAKELSISFDEPTGIRTIDNVENTVDNDAWYTVNGVRLQGEPATKGVYIHNGKKVVVK